MLQENGKMHPGLAGLRLHAGFQIKAARSYRHAVIIGKAGLRACAMVSLVDDLLAAGRPGYLVHVFQSTPEVVSREAPFETAQEYRLGYWNDLKKMFQEFDGRLDAQFYDWVCRLEAHA